MHSLLDPFGLDCEDDSEVTKPNRVAEFRVDVVQVPLFYTATWKIVVYIDGREFTSSEEVDQRPSNDVVNDWTRQFIRFSCASLASRNVDIGAAYHRYGGDPRDIYGFY